MAAMVASIIFVLGRKRTRMRLDLVAKACLAVRSRNSVFTALARSSAEEGLRLSVGLAPSYVTALLHLDYANALAERGLNKMTFASIWQEVNGAAEIVPQIVGRRFNSCEAARVLRHAVMFFVRYEADIRAATNNNPSRYRTIAFQWLRKAEEYAADCRTSEAAKLRLLASNLRVNY
jgi:hypothetical protein